MPAEDDGDCPDAFEVKEAWQALAELKKALDSDWKAMQSNPLILEVQMIRELKKLLDMANEVPRKVWGEIWNELKAFAACDVKPLVARVKTGAKHANAVLRALHGLTSILQGYVHDQIDASFKGMLDGQKGLGKAGVKLSLVEPRVQLTIPADAPMLGPPAAPVTMVEFLDYQCPYCHRVQGVVDFVLQKYPGKVRFVHTKRICISNGHPQAGRCGHGGGVHPAAVELRHPGLPADHTHPVGRRRPGEIQVGRGRQDRGGGRPGDPDAF